MPHPKPAEGNVALIRPPEGAVAAAAPASEADDRWVWFEDEHGERFRVPRSWVQGTPADASNAGGSAEEADPDEAGGIHIKNPTLSRMFEGVRLTSGQASLVPKLQAFLDDDEARIFILRGYAGTGKTFLMKGVVDYLSAVNRSVHLMAPTGRAAKVLSTRTSRSASTIHAHLYSPRDRDDPDDEDFTLVSDLTSNTDELDAVYVVDEASMVSDRETQNPLLQFGSGRLLADLLHFLEDAPCAHRRHILFVGDAAQLPPVGMTVSPALSPVHLEEEFGLKPSEHTLTDIVRQKQDSGILALATALRTGLKNKTYALPRLPADVPDVERIDARDMARLCWEVMGRRITRDAVMIAQTNVRAQQLNRAFRRLQFPGVEELAAGDKLMVILNTHMHGEFICNGDFCQVLRTGARTRRSVSFRVKTGPAGKGRRLVNLDLEFQSVTLRLRGNTGECFEVSCMILLNQLEPDDLPDMTLLLRALMADFKNRFPRLRRGTKDWQDALAEDPFVNALHVRYGYAVTCHKSQGSEWPHVSSLSGEFGWRFDLARTVWIEPQIEATYTHAGAEDLTLSNGVNAATYEIGDFDSLIGRAGFATGFTCPNNRGEVWLRASAVHEFLGDREIFARTGDNTNSLKQDGKDTWFEYGIGANFNLSESTYLWADVERTSGGIIDQEWRATIGVRYGF